jgi:D-tyrosyl-tRNA(Tyr) deacylase
MASASDIERRLVGDDGAIYNLKSTTAVVGTATSGVIPAKTLVKIVAVGTFAPFVAIGAGGYYYSPIETGATTANPLEAASWISFGLSNTTNNDQMLDIVSASLDVSVAVIEVTALADRFKVKRSGKKDATGSASFLFE